MNETYEQQDGNTELWQQVFGAGHPDLAKQHRFHRRLPRDPRCKLCFAPFKGIGGAYMRFKGKSPSSRNPKFCNACDGFLETFPGGAEVEMSIIFVDIRNSTSFAEGAAPAAVGNRVNAFLTAATQAITAADGFILAFYGDSVVGVWPPGFSGPDHAAKALAAARDLARNVTVRVGADEPVPYGIGIHTGPVFIGTVQAAKGLFRDVSIFGSNVILTARLAAAAKASEALVSTATLTAAGETPAPEMVQSLDLKGITDPVQAISVT